MSEKVERTIPKIQEEYQVLATRAGHAEYQIYTLKRDLDLMYGTMRDLNVEAATIQSKEQPKKEEESNAS